MLTGKKNNQFGAHSTCSYSTNTANPSNVFSRNKNWTVTASMLATTTVGAYFYFNGLNKGQHRAYADGAADEKPNAFSPEEFRAFKVCHLYIKKAQYCIYLNHYIIITMHFVIYFCVPICM